MGRGGEAFLLSQGHGNHVHGAALFNVSVSLIYQL